MRLALSPLMHQVEAHILSAVPEAEILQNVPGDSLIVRLARNTFSVSPPFRSSYEAKATWPIYVTPVPSPEPRSWECHTLDEIIETLAWPDTIPAVRTATVAEIRARAGIQ
jgi:hypothetical protein